MCKYGYLHMCASAHQSQKNTLDPLELESLEVACYLMRMLGYTLRPSKEQQVLLTIEAMPTSPLIIFSQTYGSVPCYVWGNVRLDPLPIIIRCLECQDWGVWISYMFGGINNTLHSWFDSNFYHDMGHIFILLFPWLCQSEFAVSPLVYFCFSCRCFWCHIQKKWSHTILVI